MTITKQTAADKIAAYLHHEITLGQLVDWSENALLDGELAEHDAQTVSSVIARLGVFMVLIAALSAALAVLQGSPAFALLAITGGFLAPILASSGNGDHVVLFSYYVVLNAAILVIAWFKAWRPLNLAGFVFTFVIATLWGVLHYRPEDFATTEPFLILFFDRMLPLRCCSRSVSRSRYADTSMARWSSVLRSPRLGFRPRCCMSSCCLWPIAPSRSVASTYRSPG